MTPPPRVVLTILATIGLVAGTVVAVVSLYPRHKVLAILLVVGALLAMGWIIFILPAYWD